MPAHRRTWLSGKSDSRIAKSRLDRRLLPELADRIKRYFDGQHVGFADVPTPAGPDFHVKCWNACRKIPRGQMRSYAHLAILAGAKADGARAAGQAMRNNPLPIVIPCHRVVASSGKLHGFAGSSDESGKELAIKRALLELEGANLPAAEPAVNKREAVGAGA